MIRKIIHIIFRVFLFPQVDSHCQRSFHCHICGWAPPKVAIQCCKLLQTPFIIHGCAEQCSPKIDLWTYFLCMRTCLGPQKLCYLPYNQCQDGWLSPNGNLCLTIKQSPVNSGMIAPKREYPLFSLTNSPTGCLNQVLCMYFWWYHSSQNGHLWRRCYCSISQLHFWLLCQKFADIVHCGSYIPFHSNSHHQCKSSHWALDYGKTQPCFNMGLRAWLVFF